MGLIKGKHQIEVAASAKDCFGVITDYVSYPDFWPQVSETEIISEGEDGLATVVEFVVDAVIKKPRYQLRYEYQQPKHVSWTYGGGDIKDMYGYFQLEKVGKLTSITYELAADPGFWTPPGLAGKLQELAVKRGLDALRERIEIVSQ